MKKRLNDATPEEWDRVNAPQHVYYGGERVEYPVRAYTYGETDPVTEEDLDELFADGSFTSPEGYDTYEEYMAKVQLKEEQESALDKQVGSDHYKVLGIQPLESTYLNFGYEGLKAAVYTKVQKYLLRDKESEVEDIKKAIHCLEILLEKADG